MYGGYSGDGTNRRLIAAYRATFARSLASADAARYPPAVKYSQATGIR
jgi:hypothetical protein